MPRKDAFAEITAHVLRFIESDRVLPWRKPWRGDGLPVNGLTGRHYSGTNLLVLMLAQMKHGYPASIWMTYKQVQQWAEQTGRYTVHTDRRGAPVHHYTAHVRRGEKATPVMVVHRYMKEDEDAPDGEREVIYTRVGHLFNLAQIEGATVADFLGVDEPFYPHQDIEGLLESLPQPVRVQHDATEAYYSPTADVIHLPPPEDFRSDTAYYLTRAHETGHATGHSRRLDRPGIGLMPDDADRQAKYSLEELTAEFFALFFAVRTGLDIAQSDRDNSATYIKGWVEALSRDDAKTWLTQAANDAQAAIRYVFGEDDTGADTEPDQNTAAV